MRLCSSLLWLWLLLNETGAQERGPPRSFTQESVTCGIHQDGDVEGEVMYPLDYNCDSLQPPTAWQKKSADSDVDYDLIVVGGGIGGAYLANRMVEEFERKNQDPPKIAFFERNDDLGGRLQSGFGTGALGLSVTPRTENKAVLPLQEYGGMRIDPYRYPLMFNRVLKEGQAIYGADRCLSIKDCRYGDNCCPDMLARMEVGGIRYVTTRTDMGILSNSSVLTSSESYDVTPEGKVVSSYSLQNIADGEGSPFDKCLQLVVAADEFYKDMNDVERSILPWKDAIESLCIKCDSSGISGLCKLCDQFPKPAEAVLSCSGYDGLDSQSLESILSFVDEVLNVKRETNLYIFRFGFQRFVMGLLERNEDMGIAPQYRKTLVRLSLEGGKNASELAQEHIDSLSMPAAYEVVPNTTRVLLHFADGSTVSAKSVYLGMLPYDLPMVRGLEAWDEPLAVAASTRLATKMVLGWKDPNKALPAMFNMTPCTPGPCQRLILDGNHSQDWMPRQVWLWDDKTVLLYGVGSTSTNETKYPAHTMQRVAADGGMDALVALVMDQIRAATNMDVDDPDWARLKPWPQGTFTGWKVQDINNTLGTTPAQFAAHISRPLGYEVPVYYGNSEAAPNDDNHGWAEGALEMAEDSLQSLASYLGLKGKVVSPPRDKINVTQALLELEAEQQNTKRASSDSPTLMKYWTAVGLCTFSIVMMLV